jgi:hypothetical protein
MPTTPRLVPSYRVWVSKGVSERVSQHRGIAVGREVVAAWQSIRLRGVDPERAYKRALAKHQQRLGRLRTAAFAGGVVSVATLVAAVAGQWWWLAGTAMALWFTGASVVALRRAEAPTPPPPAGAVRLLQVQDSLLRLIPAVEHLHPSAGLELRRAVEQAAPLLDQQARRLDMLDTLRVTMRGTSAGAAAETAAHEVEARLDRGVDAYEQLLAATATLLGAPDLGHSADAVLLPAIEGMQAYSAGLAIASE